MQALKTLKFYSVNAVSPSISGVYVAIIKVDFGESYYYDISPIFFDTKTGWATGSHSEVVCFVPEVNALDF